MIVTLDLDDPMTPILPKGTMRCLKKAFDYDYLLTLPFSNNSEHLGYLKGVKDVLQLIDNMENPQKGEVN